MAVKSLEKLCAMAILKSDVVPSKAEDERRKRLDLPPLRWTRCDCDNWNILEHQSDEFCDDRPTKKFISRLPLPKALKDFVTQVSEEICEDHWKIEDKELDVHEDCEWPYGQGKDRVCRGTFLCKYHDRELGTLYRPTPPEEQDLSDTTDPEMESDEDEEDFFPDFRKRDYVC